MVNGLKQMVEERAYNLQDRLTIYKDGYGNQTDFGYASNGQLKEVRREQDRKAKILQRYEHNARGQIVGNTDGNGEKAEYTLNNWGRIAGIDFSDGVTKGYKYTPAGQISRAVDGNGNVVQYHYLGAATNMT